MELLNKTSVTHCQILVFRSNIDKIQSAKLICGELIKIGGVYKVNVDLEDWEKVLRVECDSEIHAKKIENQVAQFGFKCAELED